MNVWTFAGALVLAAAAFYILFGFATNYLRYRRTRVITCPENLQPAAVKVDAFDAARWAAVSGQPALHLNACSRWPEMAGCGQECLAQIESSPEACLVKTIVTSWYAGKDCVYCRKPIEAIVWHERPPALRAADGTSREWKDIAPEQLPIVFRTCEPVCWHCHIVESFRKEHPEMVIERKRPEEPRVTLHPSPAVY